MFCYLAVRLSNQNIMPNVKSYTDKQIIDRVKSLPSFKHIPEDYWLFGFRSGEDAFNRTDDKIYLFKGEKCLDVYKATTNAGTDMLAPTNPRGEAVLVADEIYYDSWTQRSHRGKVWAWCQSKPVKISRDNDRDRRTEELTVPKMELTGINIHPMDYNKGSKIEKEFIQGWSQGCQTFAVRAKFDEMMSLTKAQSQLTYCLLNEF